MRIKGGAPNLGGLHSCGVAEFRKTDPKRRGDAPGALVTPALAPSRPCYGKATLVEYPSQDALMTRLAERMARRISELIKTQGAARVALPGVAALEPMLVRLSQKALNWRRVVITLTDDRWASAQSLLSNERMLSDFLFRGAASDAEFTPLYNEADSQLNGIQKAEEKLRRTAFPLDVALLELNSSMGVGSLVPRAKGLADAISSDAPPVVPIRLPRTLEPRVALSVPLLTAAERHIFVLGPERRSALAAALKLNDPIEVPVCAVLDNATIHVAD